MQFSQLAQVSASTAASLAVLATAFAVFSLTPVAVAAQDAPPAPPPAHHHPKPTNLKVLPKDITGEQLHDLMQTWAGELGVRCTTCHVVDKTKTTPDGKPVMDFANDRKEEKQTARRMFEMTEKINADYISKIGKGDARVTCGTCHRGHQKPESFEPPKPEPPPTPGQ